MVIVRLCSNGSPSFLERPPDPVCNESGKGSCVHVNARTIQSLQILCTVFNANHRPRIPPGSQQNIHQEAGHAAIAIGIGMNISKEANDRAQPEQMAPVPLRSNRTARAWRRAQLPNAVEHTWNFAGKRRHSDNQQGPRPGSSRIQRMAQKVLCTIPCDPLWQSLPDSRPQAPWTRFPSLFEKLANTHAQPVHPGFADLLRDAPGPMPLTLPSQSTQG